MTGPGWQRKFVHDLTNRGVSAWILSGAIIAFYLVLYFTDALEGPARALGLPSKWTLYGTIYTIAIITGGIFVMRRYRHNRYQIVRTWVVIVVQVTLAYSIPIALKTANQPEFYFSYFWPLKFDYLNPQYLFHLPLPFILFSFFASLLMVPVLAVFFGKRWYCSWVCGCGGLANTFGEPWRHLTSKSSGAWKFERVAIHSVLAIAIGLTALMFVNYAVGAKQPLIAKATQTGQFWYGLVVVSLLSGAVGTGLYPVGGTRVWCRNFCPMAALLGLVQKFGRYRITVKKDMCISCGMCSKFCEMGIDVRSYAQANKSFTRASCVGCGLCAEVCPRGVLRLENVSMRHPQEAALVQIEGIRPVAPLV
jgi:polyferredoxin